jgi:uncharacterized protein YjiS (DUF1127 family)
MAEMVGLSRGVRRPTGVIGGFLAALRLSLFRLGSGRRNARLELDEWPDYLLRDIGLDRSARDGADPRSLPTDWLAR